MPATETWQNGRKTNPKYYHPLDNVALDTVNQICEILHDAFGDSLTPNIITTMGNILRFTGLWLLYQRRCAWEAGLFTFLGLFLDFIDGHYARKYDQVTILGDYYDHVSDWVWAGSLGIIFLCRYKLPMWLYGIFAIWLPVYVCHFAAREALREEQDASPTVKFTKIAMLGYEPEKVAQTLKYVSSDFGLAVFVSALVCWVILKNRA